MGKRSFIWNLAKDPTANTIAISAAALVPLVAMVGGGVDASRYYMATTRMQAACDAGALAARRAMTTDEFTSEHRTIGENFFDQNYEEEMFGLESGTRAYTSNGEGTVYGTASGTLPTSLMGIFGYDQFQISVECSAEINISNTDIMFVLDVTGSMNCAPDNPSGGSCNNTEASNAKIKALRSAVMNFYDTVEDATSDSAQVRYGIVPYASNVNVGDSLRDEWMAPSHTFQSRWAKWEDVEVWEEVGTNIVDIDFDEDVDGPDEDVEWRKNRNASQCAALAPDDFDWRLDDNLGTHNQVSQVQTGDTRVTTYEDGNERFIRGEGFSVHYPDSRGRWCKYGWRIYRDRADVTFEVVEERTTTYEFQHFVYEPVDTANPPPNPRGMEGWEDVDLSTLYDDDRIELPTGWAGEMQVHAWDGCIEEASTVATADFSNVNDDFNDLDINLIPDEEGEYWAPLLRNATWKREDSGGNTLDTLEQDWNESRPSYSCPAAAFRLTEISRNDLEAYVNDLRGRSNTYHDIGMIWGARFISPNGIFGSDNATAPNGDAISRHIVFMTDGILAPNVEVYGTYGVEWWSRRVTDDGSSAQARDRHAQRFQAACRAARRENISVWVVAFGTELTSNLENCATPGRAYSATDAESLDAAFQEIAQKIAALRLTS